MSRWVRCSYGKRAGFVNAKVGIQFQKTKQLEEKLILQVQLASAKLAICLKNSVFGFEKLSFFLGLRLSFFATFLMY